MSNTAGGRQDVSGDELRFLADKAGQASVDVARVRDRVQDLVNGLDRRGWNAGLFDDQWASTRFGLTELSQRFADDHTELLTRADEADLLNSRYFGALESIGPDAASDSMAPGTAPAAAVATTDDSPATIVQALLDSLPPDQAAQLLALLGIADPSGGSLSGVDAAMQPTPLDQLAQAGDDVLGLLGRVKDDPIGQAKQAEDALGQAKDSFLGDYPTEVDMLKGLLGMLAATPGAAPPVTCSDGRMRVSQDAVDVLNGQQALNPDLSRQNLSLLAAEAAARCGQMEATQQVFETHDGGIAVVTTMSPKDLWDELSQMLNRDGQAPRGNTIVEPPPDAAVDDGAPRVVSSGSGSLVADAEPSVTEPLARAPGSAAHKAAAWADYSARAGTQGWSYERWSAVYDANMTRARTANIARDAYWQTVGYGQPEVAVTTPDGQIRILDIADKGTQEGIEI